jgi:Transcriptional regulator, AbiEi antitoxin
MDMQGLVDEHHGVVSRQELLAAGLGPGAIEHRLRSGRLIRIYEGVYAIGHADLTVAGRRRAVVLACGDRAVLSHRSAAGAWGLRPDGSRLWEVTIRHRSRRRPAAPVRVYRHPSLAPDEVTTLDGIPITTVPRTLLDLASVIAAYKLRRAVERADQLELFDGAAVNALLERHRGRPGAPVLAALLKDFREHGMTATRSDPEALFLHICLEHGIPRPTINRSADRREIDATWPGSDLLVEIDSWKHHRSRVAFGLDRTKDRRALIDGRPTARFTADELEQAPAAVAADLRALLRRGR